MKTQLIIYPTIALAALASCKDSFDIGSLHGQPKLVVSCFPSEEDTTWIEVTRSIPVAKDAAASHYDDLMEVEHAQVVYRVNGEPRPVAWKDRVYDKWGVIAVNHGRYYVTGGHQEGDAISIEVSAPGFNAVAAHTTVATPVPIVLTSVRDVRVYDADWDTSRDVCQLTAIFTDPDATTDYYAVRLRCKHFRDPAISTVGHPDSIYSNPVILTMSEPLLDHQGELDETFGYGNGYYQDFCIFTDEKINGQTYTLHLNMSPSHNKMSTLSEYAARPVQYQVQLYHLTPEFYRHVKSINDVDNNDLAQDGLTMLSPTYSNVSGGLGVVGGYYMCESNWKTLE